MDRPFAEGKKKQNKNIFLLSCHKLLHVSCKKLRQWHSQAGFDELE